MKKITKTYEVYEFDELSQESKDIVIMDYIVFLMETADEESVVWDSILKAEANKTPWFSAEIIWEDHKDLILEDLKNSGHQFLKNGTLFGE